MAQLTCFKGSWAIYPPLFFFDIDGATQDSEPSTFRAEYLFYSILSIYLSICLSVCLSVCLSICLSSLIGFQSNFWRFLPCKGSPVPLWELNSEPWRSAPRSRCLSLLCPPAVGTGRTGIQPVNAKDIIGKRCGINTHDTEDGDLTIRNEACNNQWWIWIDPSEISKHINVSKSYEPGCNQWIQDTGVSQKNMLISKTTCFFHGENHP